MKLRRRFTVALALLVLVPLALLGAGIRRVAATELGNLFRERTSRLSQAAHSEVAVMSDALGARLEALAETLLRDRPFPTEHEPEPRRATLDYAGRALRLAGLDALEIVARDGTVLSSGQFRNQFGADHSALVADLVAGAGAPRLVEIGRPSGPFLAFARVDSLELEGQRLYLIGGIEAGPRWLARLGAGSEMELVLQAGLRRIASRDSSAPGVAPPLGSLSELVTRSTIAMGGGSPPATLSVVHSRRPLDAALTRLDGALALLLALAALGVALGAHIEARRITAPVTRLAEVARRIDLDDPDLDFAPGGDDEVGTLQSLLGQMLTRLRDAARQVRLAERRAALGDVARQVHHDVRNACAPIRNTLAHLSQVAAAEPDRLPAAFQRRSETLKGALAYLEELAQSYARLPAPRLRQPSDLNAALSAAAHTVAAPGACALGLAPDLPPLLADPLALRRIAENLLRNALEVCDHREGSVQARTSPTPVGGVRLDIIDHGPGIPADQQTRIFEPFHTTRPDGIGLGLAIVQRLATDCGARLELDSAPGRGTTFSVIFPPSEAS